MHMKNETTITLLLILLCYSLSGQISYTAHDTIPAYNSDYGYGANMGYYPGWTDEELAMIAAGVPGRNIQGAGITTLRPSLPEHFLEQWGYDIRLKTFAFYEQLGIRDNVVFVGYPSDQHKEQKRFCPDKQAEVFANLYEPIWDGGANGTPVNEDNYYALYLYKTVKRYQPYIKIWEISNEPDFDYGGKAEALPGQPGNWWENDPDPCGYALHAPVQYYVRMLRISYEVIKSIDPNALIATGGIGYHSFLDAILRNTDNPDLGKKTKAYPLGGGAYFDVLSFHAYPHIDGSLRSWNNDKMGFDYRRNSDEAVKGIINRKERYEKILNRYNYNGNNYPKKHFILTETNIPRKEFGDFIGSDHAQRNFIIKASVEAQRADIKQLHVYHMGELKAVSTATNEFDLMGLYKDLQSANPKAFGSPNAIINELGIAQKTVSDLLDGKSYHPHQTRMLNAPSTVTAVAFEAKDGTMTYVLWAKIQGDQSEAASAQYTFPKLMKVKQLKVYQWNYGYTGESTEILGGQIKLSGDPVFITVDEN